MELDDLWECEAKRKRHFLKVVSPLQIEEALAKALSELMNYPYEVEINNIHLEERYGRAEFKVSAKQKLYTRMRKKNPKSTLLLLLSTHFKPKRKDVRKTLRLCALA